MELFFSILNKAELRPTDIVFVSMFILMYVQNKRQSKELQSIKELVEKYLIRINETKENLEKVKGYLEGIKEHGK